MPITYPPPLEPGDQVAITAPSAGVPPDLVPRLDFCLATLKDEGYDVVVGECLRSDGIVSAPAPARAAELERFIKDERIRAIIPPWGGALAVELLPHLDLGSVDPSSVPWIVGSSDTSTLMLAITTMTGAATLHGHNLLDTPYRVPPPLLSWIEVATQGPGATVEQGPSQRHRAHGVDRWEDDPTVTEHTWDSQGSWNVLERAGGPLRAHGRLIGGCIETISVLAGTQFGNLPRFARRDPKEGVLLYLEAAHDDAISIARHLWRMRLAGWFEHANALLIARTKAPDANGFTQIDAVRSAVRGLDIPIVTDVDCGHVPPQLALVNGARAELEIDEGHAHLMQRLT